MAKHFELAITDNSLTFARKAESIAAEAAMKKASSHTLDDGTPVHGLQTSMQALSTIEGNAYRAPNGTHDAPTFEITTTPNPKQKRALELINKIKL